MRQVWTYPKNRHIANCIVVERYVSDITWISLVQQFAVTFENMKLDTIPFCQVIEMRWAKQILLFNLG